MSISKTFFIVLCTTLQVVFRTFSFLLLRRLLHVGNQIGAILGLLETGYKKIYISEWWNGNTSVCISATTISEMIMVRTEHHLGSRDVLLGVLEILEQSLFFPGDALLNVCLSEGIARGLAGLAAPDAVQVRSNLVNTALYNDLIYIYV